MKQSVKSIRPLIELVLVLSMSSAAWAQHHHPPQDAPIHEQFYMNWYRPDDPKKSCCNKADCYPTEVRFHHGHWQAKRREDGKWLFIPWNKVEKNRDSPDGRNHLCAPPPSNVRPSLPDVVFCFVPGAGI